MYINKARGNDQPFGINSPGGGERNSPADADDFPVLDRHGTIVPVVAGAVYDLAVADEEVTGLGMGKERE